MRCGAFMDYLGTPIGAKNSAVCLECLNCKLQIAITIEPEGKWKHLEK
jgi:hypothetical protein